MSEYQKNIRSPSIAYSMHTKVTFKLIMVGEQGVGKTSIIHRYVKGTFQKGYKVTVGVQFYSKVISLFGEEFALQIWDTAGQQNFKAIGRSFYKIACCVFIIYAKPQNIQSQISKWILELNEYANQAIKIVLVRTKIDEIPYNQQERNIILALKQKYQICLFKEVSSKNNTNITELFQEVAVILHESYIKNQQFKQLVNPKKDSFLLTKNNNQQNKQKGKSCC